MLRVIGRGSFGKVYLVQKHTDDEVYAMKTLKKDMILRKNQAEHTKGKSLCKSSLILVERCILEHVDSPFIVKLYFAF